MKVAGHGAMVDQGGGTYGNLDASAVLQTATIDDGALFVLMAMH